METEIKEILDIYLVGDRELNIDYIDKLGIKKEYEDISNEALLDYITNLQEEKDKFKLRCYKALRLIRDNYGVIDKYGIDMLDDILNGGDEE